MNKILTLPAVTFLLSACVNKESGDISVRFFTDPDTNVQYILYHGGYGSAITPRLNPDGTLYIKED